MQVYWNFEIYHSNKSQYIFSIEKAFDNAVDTYYFEIGKSDVLSILDNEQVTINDSLGGINFLNKKPFDKIGAVFKKNDTIKTVDFKEIIDSLPKDDEFFMVTGKYAMDDAVLSDLKFNNITITQTRDSIDFKLLREITDSIFLKEKIQSKYNINHLKKDTIFEIDITVNNKKGLLNYSSTSDYIPKLQKLELEFNNSSKQAFLKSLTGIILSLVLSLGIFFSIYHLIKTINKQKQLSKIKDDFISNITHEFKTPIATVSAAIEALDKFNFKDDVEKTKKYLQISNQQLLKLDTMVEKLLETSALDEDTIRLKREMVDVLHVIQKLLDKHKLISNTKTFTLICSLPALTMNIDTFYFSTALSNLLDNAEKYGGPNIKVEISKNNSKTIITIEDDGNTLKQSDASYIFDKFSRKSTGNIHEIKGNGIGLYFVKRIIEKHGGTIQLKVNESSTAFIISA